MDDDGSLSTRALFSDHVDELKGVADGAVRVRPARALVLPYLQHIVVLSHTATFLLLHILNYNIIILQFNNMIKNSLITLINIIN